MLEICLMNVHHMRNDCFLPLLPQEDHAQTLPPACKPSGPEQQPKYSATRFYARARSLLLDVGIIRPGTEVSAADITGYINSNSAPTNVGKITDPDRSDVPRFLNRWARCA